MLMTLSTLDHKINVKLSFAYVFVEQLKCNMVIWITSVLCETFFAWIVN